MNPTLRPILHLTVFLLLISGCSRRKVPGAFPESSPASLSAEEARPMHVTRALEEHPPLPSEDTQGWKGLHPAENAKTHDHNHGHDHSEHAGHPNHGVPSTAATPAATKEHDHSAQGAAPSSAEKPAVAPQEHDHTSHARHPEQEAPSQKDSTTSYSCPMHPEVVSDKPGRCPDCGMNLEKRR